METYNNIFWSSADLNSSKQAATILLLQGVAVETLQGLNFGGLDLHAVYFELFGQE